jgi:hypothetical protein
MMLTFSGRAGKEVRARINQNLPVTDIFLDYFRFAGIFFPPASTSLHFSLSLSHTHTHTHTHTL